MTARLVGETVIVTEEPVKPFQHLVIKGANKNKSFTLRNDVGSAELARNFIQSCLRINVTATKVSQLAQCIENLKSEL